MPGGALTDAGTARHEIANLIAESALVGAPARALLESAFAEHPGLMSNPSFDVFFQSATGKTPYPYQTVLATALIESRLINVPTGCGKTAAVILTWLWQRRENPTRTPRCVVYRLPIRVLVEQTKEIARWTGWMRWGCSLAK